MADTFASLDKGIPKFLRIIKFLTKSLGKAPTKDEVNAFNRLIYGRTANNLEVFAEMNGLGYVEYDTKAHTYAVSSRGEHILKEMNAPEKEEW